VWGDDPPFIIIHPGEKMGILVEVEILSLQKKLRQTSIFWVSLVMKGCLLFVPCIPKYEHKKGEIVAL
jgi:hypothetical protein